MNRIFIEVANRYNVSPDEVERDIAQALSLARKSSAPKAKAFWRQIDMQAGIEEVIFHIADRITLAG